jgi:hypothetical protein
MHSANADKHTFLVAILTFAILFHLSLVLDEETQIGENAHELAIPAVYVNKVTKSGLAMPARPLSVTDWILRATCECGVIRPHYPGGGDVKRYASPSIATGLLIARSRPPTPHPRSKPVNSLEGTVERRLVRKSALNGDFGKGQAGIRHKISGPIHSAFSQPFVRRSAKGLFERPGKVAQG